MMAWTRNTTYKYHQWPGIVETHASLPQLAGHLIGQQHFTLGKRGLLSVSQALFLVRPSEWFPLHAYKALSWRINVLFVQLTSREFPMTSVKLLTMFWGEFLYQSPGSQECVNKYFQQSADFSSQYTPGRSWSSAQIHHHHVVPS